MASSCIPDAWRWITSLPPITQWCTDSMSLCIVTSESAQASLDLSSHRNLQSRNPCITFSISSTNFSNSIPLWTSKSFPLESKARQLFGEESSLHLFFDIIIGVLRYGSNKKSSFRLPPVQIDEDFAGIFNSAFLTLTFLVCIYEAPRELRDKCINTLTLQVTSSIFREAIKLLVRILGSNLEEQWMRSVNLAITNWMTQLHSSNCSSTSPSPLFSYAISASRLWKVQLYCPIIAMRVEDPSSMTHDNRLICSLNYQQLEGVFQLAYKVGFRQNWIDVVVNVDNIRCDVSSLISETLMNKQGYGSEEKHFPSRVYLQLTPTLQTDVLSVSVSKSSDNPTHEVGLEKGLESSFDPPSSLGLKVSAAETVTMSMKPWKFEQYVHGNSAILNWSLHDGVNGREVVSSKPYRRAIFQPRSWFRNRYSTAYRPFTKQGGVVFAGDEFGDSVSWKVCGEAAGKTMEWEIRCWIWLTYWPNKKINFYSETRRLQFKELVYIPLTKMNIDQSC